MSTFCTKFETESSRVKGVCFHPSRPWFLASLHTGTIQLWDYRIGCLLDTFEEHVGPVRAVDFHQTQPLFVSGGDDFKVKVWNYKQRRCLFTLTDHLDYIRTVQFHHEYPWVLTASDDQTIRIFNWQNRQCVTVLTGHNHYVMSARFHPKEDLVVSASLDQTVRVWDIAALRSQQTSAPQRPPEQESAAAASLRLAQQELFGGGGGSLKFPPLEGHERGVNWAAFHPTLQLIVSAADDRTVKLWRMNDTKAWEVDTLRGHFNNVSCVLFHPRADLILSNSEDKTVRVWDMAKRTCLHTFRREHDRFWIMAAHPEQNVFAAGHDSGVLVFKLERERPAFALHKGKRQTLLFYVKDRHLRSVELDTGKDAPLLAVRKPSSSWRCVAMSYNAAENAALLQSKTEEGGSYELYRLPVVGTAAASSSDEAAQCKRGLGSDAVWVGRNKFAVLERAGQIVVRTADNEVAKRHNAPLGTQGLLGATSGRVICRTDEGAVLVDLSKPTGEETVGRVAVQHCRAAVWGGRKEAPVVALLGKHTVALCTRELQQLCSVQETVKIKSAAWDESSGMLVYTTVNHIKYLLPNGDGGIVRTLDVPLYLAHVKGNRLHLMDRECKIKSLAVDITECYFKMALFNQSFDTVLRMVREANLVGNAMVGYLQRKGHPDVALHFVKDPQVRFNLALQCGQLDVALAAARQLEDPASWSFLAQAALETGDYATAELGLTRAGDTAGLAMLLLCGGKRQQLARLAASTGGADVMAAFHSNVLRGDVGAVASQLEKANLAPLAFVCYASHGLTEDAGRLAAQLQEKGLVLPARPVPPELAAAPNLAPVLVEAEPGFVWPLLAGRPRSALDAALASQKSATLLAAAEVTAASGGGGEDLGDWGGDDLALPGSEPSGGAKGGLLLDEDQRPPEEEGGGWGDLDLDTVLVSDTKTTGGATTGAGAGGKDFFVAPPPGESKPTSWVRTSRLPCDAAAAGDWTGLSEQLANQVGVVKLAPLRPYALAVFRAARIAFDGLTPLPSASPLQAYLTRGTDGRLPQVCVTLAGLVPQLQEAYAAMNQGKFSTARAGFLALLHALVFVYVDTRDGEAEAQELLGICREYLTGIHLEMTRKEEKDGKRAACLAAYFSHCKLQPKHIVFVLRTAMKASLDIKNYLGAASFARRILDLSPSGQFADAARQVVQFAEKTPSDAVRLDYDERNPFSVCCGSLVPIYKGSESVGCPYCKAKYLPSFRDSICTICLVGKVGKAATGMVISSFK